MVNTHDCSRGMARHRADDGGRARCLGGTTDGTLSLLGDWEWFVPITDQHERFANKRRYRGGVGYRHNRAWGLSVLYIRTNSRNTIDAPFSTSENILDVQVKRAW